MSNPNPPQVFELNVWAEGVVTSTNGEPVPDATEQGVEQ